MRSDPSMPIASDRPAHLRVAGLLRHRIAGDATPGGFLPAERDLAREFAVGRNTLRRAIRSLADEGLLDLSLNCRPRIARRAAAATAPAADGNRLTHIALLTPVAFGGRVDPAGGEYDNLLGGVVTTVEKAGAALVYINTTAKDVHTRAGVARLLPPIYDGVILHVMGAPCGELVAALERSDRPAVLVGSGIAPAATCIHTVDVDQAAGFRQAMAHLRAAGRRRIVHVTYDEPAPWVELRAAAYRTAAGSAGQAHEVLRVASTAMMERVDRMDAIAARIADRLPADADAAIAGNDFLAACVARAVRGSGRRVPEDVAVVGFDDVRHAVEHGLSSVSSMAFEQGRRAAQILLQTLAAGPAGPCHRERIPPRLVLRASTPPVDRPAPEDA